MFTETLSAVSALVRAGTCQIGVVGPAANTTGLEREHLLSVRMVSVVAPLHPLAQYAGKAKSRVGIKTPQLAQHVHIVLSERGDERTPDQAVLSPRTWRILCSGSGTRSWPLKMTWPQGCCAEG